MRKLLIGIIGALALSAAGCGDPTGPSDELAAARQRWANAAYSTYTVTLHVACECGVEMSGPVVTSIRNGVVQSRRYVITGESVPAKHDAWFPTIEGLFDLVAQGLSRGWSPMHVQYDPASGYPTRVEIPSIAQQNVFTVSVVRH
jgi:hypothetical protein